MRTNLCVTAKQTHTRALRSSRQRAEVCLPARPSRWGQRHSADNPPDSSLRPRSLHQSDSSAPFGHFPSPLRWFQRLADPDHVVLAGTLVHLLRRWSNVQRPAQY